MTERAAAVIFTADERIAVDAHTLEALADLAAAEALRRLEAGHPVSPRIDQLLGKLTSAETCRDVLSGGPVDSTSDAADDGGAVRQPGLLDRRQAAEKLGIGLSKLADLDRSGDLAAVRIGRRVLYRPEDVETYIEERHGNPNR